MSNIIKLPECKCKECMDKWLDSVLDAGLAPTEEDLLLLENAKPRENIPEDQQEGEECDNEDSVDDTASVTEDSLPPVNSELVSYSEMGDELFTAIDCCEEDEGVLLFNFLLNNPLRLVNEYVYCGKELIALISEYERRILVKEGV